MGVDDRLRDGEAQPSSRNGVLGCFGGAEEALEQMVLLFRRNAHARVPHLDDRVPALPLDANVDTTAGRRELDAVRDQVVEELRKARAVARDQGQRPCREGERDVLALDDAQELPLLVRQRARLLLEDELEVAADRGQRRSELVRDERDELVLEAVELAKPLILVGELQKQPLPLRLRPATLGDVVGDRGGADYGSARVAKGREGKRDVDQPAVLAPAHGLEVGGGLAGRDLLEEGVLLMLSTRRRQDRNRLADDLLGRVAEHALGARVPARETSV